MFALIGKLIAAAMVAILAAHGPTHLHVGERVRFEGQCIVVTDHDHDHLHWICEAKAARF